jgi:FkbM family methyltransferase
MNIKKLSYCDIIIGTDEISKRVNKEKPDWMFDGHLKKYYDQYINKNSIVLDIGANIGTHSLYFSNISKKVYAFEAQRILFYHLCANIFLNQRTNIYAFNNVVYDKKSLFSLTENTPNYFSNHASACLGFSEINTDNTHDDKDIVNSIRIDDINFESVDFIKIDAQGSDLICMRGAVNTIKKFKPIITFEIENKNLLNVHGISHQDHFDFLDDIGYGYKHISYGDYLAFPI